MPGATVLLVNLQSGHRKETWSDEGGRYTLANIPSGEYRLEVSLVGFATSIQDHFQLVAAQSATVDLKLSLAKSGSPNAGSELSQRTGIPSRANERPDWGRLSPEVRQRMRAAAQAIATQAEVYGTGNGQTGPPDIAGGRETVRFSANLGDPSSSQDPQLSSNDQASSANSFLLTGSTVEASTPGDNGRAGTGGMGGRFGDFQGAPGFGAGGERRAFGAGGGIPEGGGGFGGGGFGGGGFGFFGARGGRRPRVNRVRGNVLESYTNSAFDARPYPLNGASSRQTPAYTSRRMFRSAVLCRFRTS